MTSVPTIETHTRKCAPTPNGNEWVIDQLQADIVLTPPPTAASLGVTRSKKDKSFSGIVYSYDKLVPDAPSALAESYVRFYFGKYSTSVTVVADVDSPEALSEVTLTILRAAKVPFEKCDIVDVLCSGTVTNFTLPWCGAEFNGRGLKSDAFSQGVNFEDDDFAEVTRSSDDDAGENDLFFSGFPPSSFDEYVARYESAGVRQKTHANARKKERKEREEKRARFE